MNCLDNCGLRLQFEYKAKSAVCFYIEINLLCFIFKYS